RTAQRTGESGTGWWMLAAAMGSVLALAVALVAVVMAGSSDGDPAATGAGGAASGGPQTIQVELTEFAVEPAAIEIAPGTDLTLEITNAGTMVHDLKLDGTTGSGMLDPGATETVHLGTIDASTQAWCTVPGHKQAGMVMDITVTGGDDRGAGGGRKSGGEG